MVASEPIFRSRCRTANPITGLIRDEFHIGTRGPGDGSTHRLPYSVATLHQPEARLVVRDRESEPRTEIPRGEWEFVDGRTIRLLPEGRKFEPFRIYELWYEATEPTVLGIGFASVRDLVSFLRFERDGNPILSNGGAVKHALGFGVSQSGRFLRHFLELGMNTDSAGRRVFDGVLSHVAGAGKVFANHRFGMPGRTATQHEDRLFPENWFPFSMALSADPVSGRTDGILPALSTGLKVIETNSSTEYWQKGASLIHTDLGWGGDLFRPEDTRVYLIAGTQHGGRPGVDPRPGPCLNPRNPQSATPALRALFVALEEWVTEGVPPRPAGYRQSRWVAPYTPPLFECRGSTVLPTRRATTRSSPGRLGRSARKRRRGLRNLCFGSRRRRQRGRRNPTATDRGATGHLHRLERLPRSAAGIGRPRRVADPVCSHPCRAHSGGRPSRTLPEERYGSHDGYIAKVEAAAAALIDERLLLPQDAAAFVAAARDCDRF